MLMYYHIALIVLDKYIHGLQYVVSFNIHISVVIRPNQVILVSNIVLEYKEYRVR